MVEVLRPARGGFLRPFGCGWFIREFLPGHGPEGSPTIEPERGACQADIFYHYKLALHRAYAEDAVAWENEERIRAGKPIYSPEEYAERVDWHLRRIPYKLVKARYHSFQRYFHWLKQLGWVEETKEREESQYLGGHPRAVVIKTSEMFPGRDTTLVEVPQPRRFYRLTSKGKKVSPDEWSYPQSMLYPDLPAALYERTRKEKRERRRALRVD